ncbi:metal ABC transporter permease [Litorisediminicola beolgyonensis]|uniref:High-affinity zinc uptake system membrane protein ZnuB n=1 Tax=Litorisediminicola beolgyonensis TaxID=1173614 RepID=A0ABW3ZDM5_9RHOB
MSLLDDFFVRALLAGLGVAVAAAPLGAMVVWRRMAYFGDATAHAAILGVALSLALGLPVIAGALAVALALALSVTWLTQRGLSSDAGLGVLAHAALGLGLVAASLAGGVRIDLAAFLFGDILAVTRMDLLVIWGGAVAVLALMASRWQALLTSTLSPELALASGIDPRREELVLTLALAVTVAVAIKVVGVLLIGAMLLIPPTAARPFATSPEHMALGAGLVGAASALGGLWVAFWLDTPAGPSVVSVAALIFVLSQTVSMLRA